MLSFVTLGASIAVLLTIWTGPTIVPRVSPRLHIVVGDAMAFLRVPAIKRVLARRLEAAVKQRKLSKAEMARRMHTCRAALDRLLDPQNDAVTLSTLRRAAIVVGRDIRLELV